jgi:hypothetical protein
LASRRLLLASRAFSSANVDEFDEGTAEDAMAVESNILLCILPNNHIEEIPKVDIYFV